MATLKWIDHGEDDWHGYVIGQSSRRFRVVQNLGGDFVAWHRVQKGRKYEWEQITGLLSLRDAIRACRMAANDTP